VARRRFVTGRMKQGDTPDWQPLARVVDEHLMGWFMWMFEVATPGGRPIHAYKHIATRGYLHLDMEGSAYVYVDEDRYRRIDLDWLLELVLRPWWEEGLGADLEDVTASWAAIERARRAGAALGEGGAPGDGGALGGGGPPAGG